MVAPPIRNESPERDEDDGFFLFDAFARGIDQSQAMLYATANALSSAVGIDFIAEWGEEGMERNIREMMKNPPKVETWDDVDGLADAGAYVLERMAEQIPSLGAQLVAMGLGGAAGAAAGPAGAAAGAAAGAGARRGVLAMLGKAVSRRVGPNATQEMRRRTAGQMAAGYAYATSENAGESRMNQLVDGREEADAPVTALATGVAKGALDMLGFDRMMRAMRVTGLPADEIATTALKKAAEIGGAAGVEGVTEGAQTFIDQMSMSYLTGDELISDANTAEIKESMIAGAAVGGGLTATAAGVRGVSNYLDSREQQRLDEEEMLRDLQDSYM